MDARNTYKANFGESPCGDILEVCEGIATTEGVTVSCTNHPTRKRTYTSAAWHVGDAVHPFPEILLPPKTYIPHKSTNQIESQDVPAHDFLTAGFPCQSFSVAGDGAGLDDHRGVLFFEVLRMLQAHKPKAFLLENVPHMIKLEVFMRCSLSSLDRLPNGCAAYIEPG